MSRSSARPHPKGASGQAPKGRPRQRVPQWLKLVASYQPSVKTSTIQQYPLSLGERAGVSGAWNKLRLQQQLRIAQQERPQTVQSTREINKPSSEQTPLHPSQRCQFVHGLLNQAIFGF